MKKYLISACLIGENVRYDGKNCLQQQLKQLIETGQAVTICPEVSGGLSTPRPPAAAPRTARRFGRRGPVARRARRRDDLRDRHQQGRDGGRGPRQRRDPEHQGRDRRADLGRNTRCVDLPRR